MATPALAPGPRALLPPGSAGTMIVTVATLVGSKAEDAIPVPAVIGGVGPEDVMPPKDAIEAATIGSKSDRSSRLQATQTAQAVTVQPLVHIVVPMSLTVPVWAITGNVTGGVKRLVQA